MPIDIHLLDSLGNTSALNSIVNHQKYIENDIQKIREIFRKIYRTNSTLPVNFIAEVFVEVGTTLIR